MSVSGIKNKGVSYTLEIQGYILLLQNLSKCSYLMDVLFQGLSCPLELTLCYPSTNPNKFGLVCPPSANEGYLLLFIPQCEQTLCDH